MIRGAANRTPLFRLACREPCMELPSMTSKTIVGNRHELPQANRNELPGAGEISPSQPLLSPQQLNRLAAGILSDATHRPLELLERFDTQQQGE